MVGWVSRATRLARYTLLRRAAPRGTSDVGRRGRSAPRRTPHRALRRSLRRAQPHLRGVRLRLGADHGLVVPLDERERLVEHLD
eukprot:scaffold97250_cov46-Phaeocystis_antarctica.AAC.3